MMIQVKIQVVGALIMAAAGVAAGNRIAAVENPKGTITNMAGSVNAAVIPKPLLFETGDTWCPARRIVIVIPSDATEGETFAARELADWWGLIAKSGIPKVTTPGKLANLPENDKDTRVFLGRAIPTDAGKRVLEVDAAWLGCEGYALEIRRGQVFMRSASDAGLLYAAETIVQIAREKNGILQWPEIFIKDRPRFGYRGLCVAPGHNFINVAYLKRLMEMMCFAKLNVLHIHFATDPGWTIESRKFPWLVEKGARKNQKGLGKGFYTQEEIKELVAFGLKRGINIIPGIQMPGHSAALNRAVRATPDAWFRGWLPAREESYRFVEELVSELAGLFPFEYVHINTDEFQYGKWRDDESLALKKKLEEKLAKDRVKPLSEKEKRALLFQYFVARAAQSVVKAGKTPVGWNAIASGTLFGLPEKTIVQNWLGENRFIPAMVKDNRRFILSQLGKQRLYLDYSPAWGYPGWGSPKGVKGVRAPASWMFSECVIPAELGARAEKLCLGLEGCMWGEYCKNYSYIDLMIWPRALAVAELAWSPERRHHVSGRKVFWPCNYFVKNWNWKKISDKKGAEYRHRLERDANVYMKNGDKSVFKWAKELFEEPEKFNKAVDRMTASFIKYWKPEWEEYQKTTEQFEEFRSRAVRAQRLMKARWNTVFSPLE